MKNYNFKDSRPIFRWLYYAYGLSTAGILLNIYITETPIQLVGFTIILNLVILLVIYKKTNFNVYVDEQYIKANKMSAYMMITKITATTDILLWCDGVATKIKVIDFEKNYNKYKELMEYVYSKVDHNTVLECETVNELLKQVYENTMKRQEIYVSQTTNKPVLGGWLLFIMIMSWLGVISIISPIMIIATGLPFDTAIVHMIAQGIIYAVIIVLLSKRKKHVKYALAAMPVMSFISVVADSVISLTADFSALSFAMYIIYIIVSSVSSYFLAKSYIYYIDNFRRPKLTLIN